MAKQKQSAPIATEKPRRGDAAGTREKLLRAAADAFNQGGYHGTDSNRIALAAGYSPATFYAHFADKRAAFIAVYEKWMAEEWEVIAALVARREDPKLTAQRLVRALADRHEGWSGFHKSLRALLASDEKVRSLSREHFQRQLGALKALRGGAAGSRERDALVLFALERACEALSDGEVRDLRLSKNSLTRELEALLEREL